MTLQDLRRTAIVDLILDSYNQVCAVALNEILVEVLNSFHHHPPAFTDYAHTAGQIYDQLLGPN